MLGEGVAVLARTLASFAPLVGLVPRPEPLPGGISAVVRVRGEEEWIEPCLLSIQGFADEILVLDNGASPETRRRLGRLAASLGRLVRLEECPHLDIFELSNLGLARARYRWIIRWDADFVAHASGPGDIGRLREYLLGLDPRRYYLVYVAAAELAGDLFHQFPDLHVRLDGQAHTASRWGRYVPVRRTLDQETLVSPDRVLRSAPRVRVTLESLRVPKFYQVRRWETVAYFHVNVKSARHHLLRHFWLEWLGEGDFQAFPTLESFALARIREQWGVSDPDQAARHFMASYCRRLVRFDPERCGPYPELLLPYLREPRYRVEYEGGTIAGRSERS